MTRHLRSGAKRDPVTRHLRSGAKRDPVTRHLMPTFPFDLHRTQALGLLHRSGDDRFASGARFSDEPLPSVPTGCRIVHRMQGSEQ
jgi:hypothetical protein